MSRTHTANLTCPECQSPVRIEVYASVNCDRHPELREQVLDGSFQTKACECGVQLCLEAKELSWLDATRKQWLVIRSNADLPDWQEHEQATAELFETALGSKAPAVAQEIGEGMSPRLVFGLPALREKLLLRDLELDDSIVECMKLQLMKHQGIVPQAGHDFRMTARDGDALHFEVLDTEARATVQGFGVPFSLYEETDGNRAAWQHLLDQLQAGPFVDVQRLYWGV